MSCSSFDKLVLISMFGSTIGGDADGDKVRIQKVIINHILRNNVKHIFTKF